MSRYERVFLCEPYGGIKRIRSAEGASYVEEGVIKALRQALPNRTFVEIECPKKGYSTLKDRFLFIHNGSYSSVETIKRYCKALDAEVTDCLWAVNSYHGDGDLIATVGVTSSLAKAEDLVRRTETDDVDCSIRLVPRV